MKAAVLEEIGGTPVYRDFDEPERGPSQSLFGGVRDDIHLLTYQALCQADDPDGMLRQAAARHWLVERLRAAGAEKA